MHLDQKFKSLFSSTKKKSSGFVLFQDELRVSLLPFFLTPKY